MKSLFILFLSCFCFGIFAQDQDIVDGKETTIGNKRVIYVYKQYEKLDFDDLSIEGGTGSPGDLSISPIHEKRFSNELPYRKTFDREIRKGIERVR